MKNIVQSWRIIQYSIYTSIVCQCVAVESNNMRLVPFNNGLLMTCATNSGVASCNATLPCKTAYNKASAAMGCNSTSHDDVVKVTSEKYTSSSLAYKSSRIISGMCWPM